MVTKQLMALNRAFASASVQNRLKYLVAVALAALVFYLSFLQREWTNTETISPIDSSHINTSPIGAPSNHPSSSFTSTPSNHPIYKLTQDAQVRFKQLYAKRAVSLEQAASRYRERRGRHPPPGFDAWYAAAQESNAVIVEDFFDRVYHDINPFWAFDPKHLRRMIKDEIHFIRVRDGKAWFVSEHLEMRQPWVQRWTELVEEMMPHLPDLDMILNVMDETRVLVPWEDIGKYVAEEQRQRKSVHPSEALTEYTKYPNETDPNDEPKIDVEWVIDEQHKYWDHYRVTCPPDTPGRNVSSLETLNRPPIYPTEPLSFAVDGFISNFTESSDPCLQPHIRGMHGTFIESVSMKTTHSLFPMFGGCKLPGNNEILIPAGMILDSYDLFSGGETHGGDWAGKKNAVVWRGVGSGGRNKEDNWWGFQRHRFVQMMNGTTVSLAKIDNENAAPTFNLSAGLKQYNIQAQKTGYLGQWLSSFSDVAFMGYECFPRHEDESCPYAEPYFERKEKIHMKEQYEFKFLPDIDGNSYSGRFRAFMRSTSLVLKSTIYSEWHDDRLVPWVHFVPFDNTYMDIYAVLDYYLNGRDNEAHQIAEESRDWAERVMRREDMKLYVWRLLLEYARVMDPARDKLAFVDDLKG